jgi:hypothetical protein
MFEFTASLKIDTSAERLWNRLVDVQSWWLVSNPEHGRLEILSEEQEIQEGTPILIEERIAGIPGKAVGQVTQIRECQELTWEAEDAVYSFYGLPLSVQEGVTWKVEPVNAGVRLSAHVWGEFPDTWVGRMFEWVFKHIVRGVEKDYEHAMQELRYLKVVMEG